MIQRHVVYSSLPRRGLALAQANHSRDMIETGLFQVKSAVDKVSLEQVLAEFFCFPC
jgi:hypothetical protein